MAESFDVVVVGLGHAGVEAALACARTGLRTLGVTLRSDRIAVMSCNPAIGGTAKGHLVRELDALGGSMARGADLAGTHFLTLNASKGAAVRATRVLCDRDAYATAQRQTLTQQERLELCEGEVAEILSEPWGADRRRAVGIRMNDGRAYAAKAVIITTGTFLQALMHLGNHVEVGGRLGDAAATGLSASLRALGFELGRFKTGTPARLLRSSIDWSRCEHQPGELSPRPFSLQTARSPFPLRAQVACALTHTNQHTHEVIRQNLHCSPLFQGAIVGRGPRYCPSFEDKVVRFAQKARHTIFLEPEGEHSELVYPAGLSTSMPAEVQLAFLRTIRGLEEVQVARYGYAVEYDFAHPTQLLPTLETKRVAGLYFAGQLNGTSGYEEAAFQGLVAGLNASLSVRHEPPLVLGRHEAHGAVLIDELVSRGVDEPFRMLTSRSEHRLMLREGNAAFRLRHHGHRTGLVSADQLKETIDRRQAIDAELARLENKRQLVTLRRPEVRYSNVVEHDAERPLLEPELIEELENEAKYAGYIAMNQAQLAKRAEQHDGWHIPADFPFGQIMGLSAEVREKLSKAAPATVGHARRISGVTPAALSLLLVHLKRFSDERST